MEIAARYIALNERNNRLPQVFKAYETNAKQ